MNRTDRIAIIVGVALLIAATAYLARVTAPPCPKYEAPRMDSLTGVIAVLRRDSADQHRVTLELKAIIAQGILNNPSIPNQVEDAYQRALTSPDSALVNHLLSTPPDIDE